MNFGESSGAGGPSSSSSGRENGAASSDDRPHKKARFPWQVKGKHHLKNQTNLLTESPTVAPEEPETDASPSELVIPHSVPSDKIPIENSSSTISGSVMKRKPMDFDAIRSLICPSGQSLLFSGPTALTSPMSLEAVISLAESLLREAGIDCDFDIKDPFKYKQKQKSGSGPSSTVISAREARRLRRAEERCIVRWQSAQTQIGCFENTLNSVLEYWKNAPASAEERFLARMNNLLPSSDTVENEAILMAISAHGLQLPPLGNIPEVATSEQFASMLANDFPMYYDDYDSSVCSEDLELALRNSSPWPSDEDVTHQNRPATGDSDSSDSSWRQMQIHDNPSTTADEEFINNAVNQAIQSKGLMATGTDFG